MSRSGHAFEAQTCHRLQVSCWQTLILQLFLHLWPSQLLCQKFDKSIEKHSEVFDLSCYIVETGFPSRSIITKKSNVLLCIALLSKHKAHFPLSISCIERAPFFQLVHYVTFFLLLSDAHLCALCFNEAYLLYNIVCGPPNKCI